MDLQKKINKNMRNTMAMPTGVDFPPPGEGVSVSTAAAMIIQTPIPMPPMIKRTLRPNLSIIQIALIVKIMPKVALSALIRAIWLALSNTFW